MDTGLLKSLVPFFRKYNPLYVKKGQIIIEPEDKLDHIYFIEKGFVRFYHLTDDGKEFTFLIYKPGYIFPVVYGFLGKETRYYFEAMTPLTLRRATREDFEEVIRNNIIINTFIIREMVQRLEEVLEKLELLTYGNAYRIVCYILKNSAEQFGETFGQFTAIQLKLRHQDIASMSGLSRETVSIEMKKLEKEGLIRYRQGHVLIKNLAKFAKATGIDF